MAATKMKGLTASQAVVEALDGEQVEFVFGLAGTHVLPIFDALAEKPHIRHITAKHESAATYMASVYGYLTGKPGVALVTAGPGATNSITGVAQAYAASHPMVHITGGVPLGSGNEPFHGVDRDDFLHKMFADITKWSIRVEKVRDMPRILSRAFSLAASGRPGPVHVDIPEDLLRSEQLAESRYQPSAIRKQAPAEHIVQQTVEAMVGAQRPMIVAGRGVLVHRAEEELQKLAEALSAPVLCTVYGESSFPDDHPLSVGHFDEWWENPFGWELIAGSDLLLVLGMRSDTLMTEKLGRYAPDKAIFCALDEPPTLRPVPWATTLASCDIRLFLESLNSQAGTFGKPAHKALQAKIADHKRRIQRGLEIELARHKGSKPLHFGCVMQEVAAQMETDAIVLSGWGNNRLWGRFNIPIRNRDSFIGDASWGTMGSELGGGIAAKLACPGRQVMVVTGDGAMLMAAGDFVTAVEAGANILVVVMNDSRYGNIWQLQIMEFECPYGDEIGRVDFAQFAESCGGIGVRVEDPQEVKRAVSRAFELSASSPVILDVACDYRFGWPEEKDFFRLGGEAAKDLEEG